MTIISSVKSKFAKIVDGTLGACLVFFAATAVFRYYTTLDLAVFSGITVAACAVLLLHVTGIKQAGKHRLSKSSDDMFYEFLFLPDNAPSKKLYCGLAKKCDGVRLHGKIVYVRKTAAVCLFDGVTQKSLARAVAAAKHFGAARAVVFTKEQPQIAIPNIDGFDIRFVSGNDVYTLFASLNALPEPKYAEQKRKTKMFVGALNKDKAIKYLLLSACLFFVSFFTGFSVIPFACATISAILFVATVMFNIIKYAKQTAAKNT